MAKLAGPSQARVGAAALHGRDVQPEVPEQQVFGVGDCDGESGAAQPQHRQLRGDPVRPGRYCFLCRATGSFDLGQFVN